MNASAKRFWKQTSAVNTDEGWAVHLDARPVRTPAKSALILPTKAMARAIAVEWDAQEEKVDPTTMPLTRAANAAIDKVAHQHAEVADMLAAYGDSDLLCYRATHPQGLVDRQIAIWDPVLDWAAEALEARLIPVTGVMHAPQDSAALAPLSTRVHAFTPFQLAAFHDLVSISGSLILGFAVTEGHKSVSEAWDISRVDENWQEEQWGEDDEASALAAVKKQALEDAGRFFRLCE
ncbi:ATP12 family protein [Aliiroseovarius subalbicans]|uniref:ATP12 family chaperone protein n=1 Tax=Aliiroseovarius subalbicans TaxID=2925840 RepID=UPI001F5A9890|nr:ATP12 family protein [Aliiroseovarius subalbicans]MCI2401099.1 ATPase [Aliiroseovarius subalbicans]